MRRAADLTGMQFGQLTVLGRAGVYTSPKGRTAALWYCRCSCGAVVKQRGDRLKAGDVVSCGCYRERKAAERMRKMMRERCGSREKMEAENE